jgi:hypothetical protein
MNNYIDIFFISINASKSITYEFCYELKKRTCILCLHIKIYLLFKNNFDNYHI